MQVTLEVNGRTHTVDVDADTPLLWVLRDDIDLKGTKFGCGVGLCGACTVHLDGKPVRSCSLPIAAVGTAAVTTIEGIGNTPLGARLQQAWLDVDVVQCGYCQGGQIMSAAALLARTPVPSDNDIQSAMNGNLCRCGTYLRIQEAIKQAVKADLDFGSHEEGDVKPCCTNTFCRTHRIDPRTRCRAQTAPPARRDAISSKRAPPAAACC